MKRKLTITVDDALLNDAKRFARSRGSGVEATDGSGLTRSNRASPAQVVRLLTAMQNDARLADPFVQSLALSARTGTVDDRMSGSAAAGPCRPSCRWKPPSAPPPASP